MRIAVIPSDQGACGHYRLAWPTFASTHDGFDLTLHEGGSVQMRQVLAAGGRRFEVRGLPSTSDLDVAVLQRIGSENGVRLIRYLQENGVAVVIDADDDLSSIDRDSGSWRAWNRGPYDWRRMVEACQLADLVTVTTDALAKRYAPHGRVEVIPNFIPRSALIPYDDLRARLSGRGEEPYGTRVGWSGVLASHPNDLGVAHGAAHIAARPGRSLHVQGERNLGAVGTHWGLTEKHIVGHPSVPLKDYHAALDVFDVGLVPLADTAFNRAKSSLKALEYAARGIPSLVSPTPANRALSEWVRGVHVVEDKSLWAPALHQLLSDPAALAFEALQARADVEETMTIEGNVWRWHRAWRRAYDRRAALRRVR